jgi:DNA-binding LacI/PurR family transcriptional regulator
MATDPAKISRRLTGLRQSQKLLESLRRQIVSGRFPPGARLPTCRELTRTYGVSLMTAQRMLDCLVSEGFVVTRGPLGSYVVDYPPHLFRYGIVFENGPDEPGTTFWPPLWSALNQEALRVTRVDPRRRVIPFFNVNGHADVEDYQELLAGLRTSRLAGLILCMDNFAPLLHSPLFEDPTLPRVVFGTQAPRDIPSDRAAIICMADYTGLIERALDRLASRGRRRPAIVHLPGSPLLDEARWTAAVTARGMCTRPYWLLAINHHTPFTATNVIRLLVSGRPSERPDALLLANPNLVEPATAGLVAAGLRIPQDLDVVACGHFPYLTRSHVPAHWLGCDTRAVMHQAIHLIDRWRRGEMVPPVNGLPFLFEEELPSADALRQLIDC